MKITRKQLRRIIKEAIDTADDTEKINAMLGFIQEYTVADNIKVDQRLERTLKMSGLIKQLVNARSEGKLPKFSGPEKNYAKIVMKSLQGDSKGDWDDLVKIGQGVKSAE